MGLFDAELPAGRRWAQVRDFYEITRKPRDLNLRAHRTIPFVPMDAVPQGGSFRPKYEERAIEALTSGTYFERGDVLVAKITPSFENGKQAIADDLPTEFGYATTEVIPLRPKTRGHDKRLLFYYLLHPEVRAFVAERMEGSTARLRVPEDALMGLAYPEIPESEQTYIASALQKVRMAIDVEERAIRSTGDLKRVAMRELFTRGLRGEVQKETEIGLVPERWEVAALGSLGRIGNGSTPKKSVSAYWQGGTYPWLTSAKVYDRDIEVADQYVTDTALDECHLPRVKPGAVLIAITGQGKTLGHCAVLKIEATINQHIAYLQTDIEKADPGFVRGYLETQYDYLRQIAAGGGSTKGALTCAFLRELPIPLPELNEQREIVGILDALDRKISLHQGKHAILEALFESLLHKLMTGEIRAGNLDLSALGQEREPVAA